MAVLDTNVLIRYLTQDNLDLGKRAFDLLKEIEAGTRAASLPEAVLVEVVQVLSSPRLYNVSRSDIRLRLGAILRLPGIKVTSKRVFLRALDVYLEYSALSFVDSICVALAEREAESTVISFDRGFRRVPSIHWHEP